MSTAMAKRGLITLLDPDSQAADAFRTLRNMAGDRPGDAPWKVLTVVSGAPSEGKTTVAANLAVANAQAGKQVLLIDGCLKQPALDRLFALSNRKGLTAVLHQAAALDEAVQPSGVPRLSVLTAGHPPPMTEDLLDSVRMENLLDRAKEGYDLVLIDSPALLALADAATLARKSDAVLWVLRAGVSRKAGALEVRKLLQRLNVPIAGCVLNKTRRKSAKAYRHYVSSRT